MRTDVDAELDRSRRGRTERPLRSLAISLSCNAHVMHVLLSNTHASAPPHTHNLRITFKNSKKYVNIYIKCSFALAAPRTTT